MSDYGFQARGDPEKLSWSPGWKRNEVSLRTFPQLRGVVLTATSWISFKIQRAHLLPEIEKKKLPLGFSRTPEGLYLSSLVRFLRQAGDASEKQTESHALCSNLPWNMQLFDFLVSIRKSSVFAMTTAVHERLSDSNSDSAGHNLTCLLKRHDVFSWRDQSCPIERKSTALLGSRASSD